jgi:hypothetical protein
MAQRMLTEISGWVSRNSFDVSLDPAESRHLVLDGTSACSSLPLVFASPDVRASTVTLHDVRTLKFTLTVQRMPN